MTAPDDEFEEFLKRRKPVFRAPDDMFEPPSELDRVVLRQAREAIETPRPLRVFRGPRWAAPVALAATLVLAVGVVFQGGAPPKREPVPEVTVQNVAERVDSPQAATAMAPAPAAVANNRARMDAATSGPVVVDLTAPSAGSLVSGEEADRYAAPPPAAAPMLARTAETPPQSPAMSGAAMDSVAKASEVPAWRRDAKSWLAEIERLRNSGDIALADTELAEYKRQQRAYAGAPDR